MMYDVDVDVVVVLVPYCSRLDIISVSCPSVAGPPVIVPYNRDCHISIIDTSVVFWEGNPY